MRKRQETFSAISHFAIISLNLILSFNLEVGTAQGRDHCDGEAHPLQVVAQNSHGPSHVRARLKTSNTRIAVTRAYGRLGTSRSPEQSVIAGHPQFSSMGAMRESFH